MEEIDENQQIVRCNHCMHIFPEYLLDMSVQKLNLEKEECLDCHQSDALMDMGVYGEEDDKILFPYLSKAKGWSWLKEHFLVNLLCFFENEVRDIEEGRWDVEDYPTVYQWWEGLIDNKEMLEVYDGI